MDPQQRSYLIKWLENLERNDIGKIAYTLFGHSEAERSVVDLVKLAELEHKFDDLEDILQQEHDNRRPATGTQRAGTRPLEENPSVVDIESEINQLWNDGHVTENDQIRYVSRDIMVHSYFLSVKESGKRISQNIDLEILRNRAVLSPEMFKFAIAQLMNRHILDAGGSLSEGAFSYIQEKVNAIYRPHDRFPNGATGLGVINNIFNPDGAEKIASLTARTMHEVIQIEPKFHAEHSNVFWINAPQYGWTLAMEFITHFEQITNQGSLLFSFDLLQELLPENPRTDLFYMLCGPSFDTQLCRSLVSIYLPIRIVWALSVVNLIRGLYELSQERYSHESIAQCMPQFLHEQENRLTFSTTQAFKNMSLCLNGQ